jgi:hypothetical protein
MTLTGGVGGVDGEVWTALRQARLGGDLRETTAWRRWERPVGNGGVARSDTHSWERTAGRDFKQRRSAVREARRGWAVGASARSAGTFMARRARTWHGRMAAIRKWRADRWAQRGKRRLADGSHVSVIF